MNASAVLASRLWEQNPLIFSGVRLVELLLRPVLALAQSAEKVRTMRPRSALALILRTGAMASLHRWQPQLALAVEAAVLAASLPCALWRRKVGRLATYPLPPAGPQHNISFADRAHIYVFDDMIGRQRTEAGHIPVPASYSLCVLPFRDSEMCRKACQSS